MLTFKYLDEKTFDKIKTQSEKGKVNARTFYKAFNLIESDNGDLKQFDTREEVTNFLTSQGIKEGEQYKYVFTCVDGEGSKLLLINGWHYCNRLYYVVSTTSWSSGVNEIDKDLYIEVNF